MEISSASVCFTYLSFNACIASSEASWIIDYHWLNYVDGLAFGRVDEWRRASSLLLAQNRHQVCCFL